MTQPPEPPRPRHPHDRPDTEPDDRPIDDLKPSQEYL